MTIFEFNVIPTIIIFLKVYTVHVHRLIEHVDFLFIYIDSAVFKLIDELVLNNLIKLPIRILPTQKIILPEVDTLTHKYFGFLQLL